jgi:hypothetical protein
LPKSKEEILEILKESQIGIIKEYAKGDIFMYTLDEKAKVNDGIDVFNEFCFALPQELVNKGIVAIEKWDNEEEKKLSMRASCFILSKGQANAIIEFIECFYPNPAKLEKLNGSEKAKSFFKEKFGTKTKKQKKAKLKLVKND